MQLHNCMHACNCTTAFKVTMIVTLVLIIIAQSKGTKASSKVAMIHVLLLFVVITLTQSKVR